MLTPIDATGIDAATVRDSAGAERLREQVIEQSGTVTEFLVDRYRHRFGDEADPFTIYLESSFGSRGTGESALASSSIDASETNTQEAGVDEADLVETDGEFLFVVDGRHVAIIAADEGLLTPVARMELPGQV